MRTKIIISSILIFAISSIVGQKMSRTNRDLIDLKSTRPSGWMFAPGLTYMIPFDPKEDSLSEVDAKGRLAVYLEFGRWHLFPGGGNVFNYFDYSLAYKRLSGSEHIEDVKNVFKQNYLLANFNINNIIQLSDRTFLQNSLGVNLDYKFSEKAPAYGANNQRLLLSLHYRFGFGFKATKKLFIIPTLETPILNVKQWERGRSDYGMFTSRYRPLIFSVRFAWTMKPRRGDCPPVYDPANGNKKLDDMLKME